MAQDVQNNDRWIEHDGRGMPVPARTRVEVKCAGYGDDTDQADAGVYELGGPENDWWTWRGKLSDITAYRIVQP